MVANRGNGVLLSYRSYLIPYLITLEWTYGEGQGPSTQDLGDCVACIRLENDAVTSRIGNCATNVSKFILHIIIAITISKVDGAYVHFSNYFDFIWVSLIEQRKISRFEVGADIPDKKLRYDGKA